MEFNRRGQKEAAQTHRIIEALMTIAIILLIGFVAISSVSCWHTQQYDSKTYCCRHMAEDLEDSIESIFPIDVKIETGYMFIDDNNVTGHAWISISNIHIDSVTMLLNNGLPEQFNLYRHTFDDYKDFIKIYGDE